MQKILVSGCLYGDRCKYDASDNEVRDELFQRWKKEGRLVPICPEEEGGLKTPREAAEIKGGCGADVLAGKAKVFGVEGTDCTEAFIEGAKKVLKKAKSEGFKIVLLKERSPSCGTNNIYDGTFTSTKIKGSGVCSYLLQSNGLFVYSEEELEMVAEMLEVLEEK